CGRCCSTWPTSPAARRDTRRGRSRSWPCTRWAISWPSSPATSCASRGRPERQGAPRPVHASTTRRSSTSPTASPPCAAPSP
ncbi:MAG: hypothetical protein AVDCRST_MAG35-2359, partial [uncultured Quadrisphaera sp.]